MVIGYPYKNADLNFKLARVLTTMFRYKRYQNVRFQEFSSIFFNLVMYLLIIQVKVIWI